MKIRLLVYFSFMRLYCTSLIIVTIGSFSLIYFTLFEHVMTTLSFAKRMYLIGPNLDLPYLNGPYFDLP